MKKILFAIIGAIIGIPLSYYFQPEIVKSKVGGVAGYLQHFDEILNNQNLTGNVITSVIVLALIGFIIGFFMDRNGNKEKV